MQSRRYCFLVDLAIGLKPPVQFEFQSGTESVFCLVSKWIMCFSFILSGRHFHTAYTCKDCLSHRFALSCYLITTVTAGLVGIFSWWLHKKKYVIQDRTLAKLGTGFVRLRQGIWCYLSYLTQRRCKARPPTTTRCKWKTGEKTAIDPLFCRRLRYIKRILY